ncbi:recombinase family protein [Faecalicatena contorta]|uniref:recombinase family protein n=1 Tax=Faecalicatena contorta TaxID=39482 RepID=UPI001F3A6D83|nr:recombinase family protein [Faecalicatena contorta]MCF2554410.1 recombinase family protein [Faecalicatena contorta]
MRAVLYARCSTEEESQRDALVKQVQEAEECIKCHNWTLVDRYIESRSGTTTKGRNEYKRLYNDLLQDKFDIIVIKSQDRLMRNTKDWYLFIDRLVSEGKKLFIYIENKFYTTDDALITGIKAILAEDYSRELSKKINNAHKNRQKSGGNVILTSHVYGFRKLPDKSIEIIEEEAEVKRRMYKLCASGYGTRTIASILKNDGITKRSGKPFIANDVLRIIQNPLNKGCVVMGRLHYEFESKKTIRVPDEEQYIYEHMIPATVSDELWEKANENIKARQNRTTNITVGVNSCKYQLSGKIICGICGAPYYRRTRRRYKNKEMIIEWKCRTYLETGRNTDRFDRPQLRKVTLDKVDGCDNVHLDEEKFYQLLEESCLDSYRVDKERIVNKMISLLKKALNENNLQSEINRLISQKEQIKIQTKILVDKLLDGVISDYVYQEKQKELEEKLNNIQLRLKSLEYQNSQKNGLDERIKQIEESMRSGNMLEKATVAGMLEEVKKILIYPTYMEVYFDLSHLFGVQDLQLFNGTGRKTDVLRIEYGNMFNYREGKAEDREEIIELIKGNPRITAKIISKETGLSLTTVQYRMNVLKKEGRIIFRGAGGKGYWEVLK